METSLEDGGTQGNNSAEAITILYLKPSFVKSNWLFFVCCDMAKALKDRTCTATSDYLP